MFCQCCGGRDRWPVARVEHGPAAGSGWSACWSRRGRQAAGRWPRPPARRCAPPRPVRWRSGIFFERQPEAAAKARDMVAGLTVTPWVAAQVAQCSASVASGWVPTCARRAASAATPMWRCRPGRGRGATLPISRRCWRQRRIVRSGTPKVRAASACPSPASRARSKRSRGQELHRPGHRGDSLQSSRVRPGVRRN